jgi:hypothetical protein
MENGEEYSVVARFIWLDDLMVQGRLIKDGLRHVLPAGDHTDTREKHPATLYLGRQPLRFTLLRAIKEGNQSIDERR